MPIELAILIEKFLNKVNNAKDENHKDKILEEGLVLESDSEEVEEWLEYEENMQYLEEMFPIWLENQEPVQQTYIKVGNLYMSSINEHNQVVFSYNKEDRMIFSNSSFASYIAEGFGKKVAELKINE